MREDNKIKAMLAYYRKESEYKAQASVCIYWWIVEDMHKDAFPVKSLSTFADSYRCDVEFLKEILENFGLFRIEDDCYISDRVLKNLKEQKEKREKARKAAYFRWKKEYPPKEETEETEETKKSESDNEIDNEIVDKIISLFNEEFEKEQVVSVENREKIHKITKQNKLTLEHWQKIFHTAKRGWNINGQKKKPSFDKILDKWDSFASDDYNLAPDTETTKKEREREAEQERERRRQEEEEKKNFLAAKAAIKDKETAIEFINKYFLIPDKLLKNSKAIKEYCDRYNFTIDELIESRRRNGTQI